MKLSQEPYSAITGVGREVQFQPGDTGFRAIDPKHGRIGCGICWDQWFPKTARPLALQGAEVLLFPTAIGSEPLNVAIDSMPHRQRTMQGHAAANLVPLDASNRVGTEVSGEMCCDFYGSSFIADHPGDKVAETTRINETYLTATFGLEELKEYRRAWGIFRDRRPEMYGAVWMLDGVTVAG